MTKEHPHNYTNDERAAMRAYVQRSEVRLSTMHRVAGSFLNGAGLLILLPVLFRDIVENIATFLFTKLNGNLNVGYAQALMYGLLIFPFLVSMYIPLRALYLLLKDLVDFYFIGHSPNFSDRLFSPRFALSGIAFSPDEGENVKKDVLQHEYEHLLNFVLPFEETQLSYYDEVKSLSLDLITPPTRTKEYLESMGLRGKWNDIDADRFNTAFGLAGVVDRNLSEEVAKTETSLVRHALSLRRLVLRYAKALLAVVWTTIISFIIITISKIASEPGTLIAFCYILWSLAMRPIVQLPINWIFESASQNALKITAKDQQLVKFENDVFRISVISTIVSALVVVISVFIK